MEMPTIRYAWRGDVSLAYQVLGDGPVDLVYMQGFLSNVELNWENPALARFLRELAASTRLIVTDRRGLGLSERFTPADTPPTEVLMDDVKAVLEAAGSDRPVIMATGDCGWIAMLYAATYPERVSALILYGTSASWRHTDETPWGQTDEEIRVESEWVRDHLGTGRWMEKANPSLASHHRELSWGARYERLSLTPGAVYSESLRFAQADVRSVLPLIQVPVLVLHRIHDPEVVVDSSRHLADTIRTARLVELAGRDHFPWIGDQDAVLREVSRFLATVEDEEIRFDSVLSTVLFTDIVDSTRRAAELGDAEWSETVKAHNAVIRSLIARYQGREVNTTGDGFVATFDSPARAIRCAVDAHEAVGSLGLEIRAGCHTGEIRLIGDDVGGVAVHTAARVAGLAGPGETLVSRTVKDLVAGSSFQFAERGVHELKGVPGKWPLYAILTDH